MTLRVGIDVGGTNTDAVAVTAAGEVVAKVKTPTTADVAGGIAAAGAELRAQLGPEAAGVSRVMVGTTHATNAVLERRNLRRVAVVRIGSPAADATPPLAGWPDDLREAVDGGVLLAGGGSEVDGRRIAPLDTDRLRDFLDRLPHDVAGVVLSAVFAPISPVDELAARDVVRSRRPNVHITMSHEIGSVGLLERENAAVLNEALGGVVDGVLTAMRDALRGSGFPDASVAFVQNDGTLMNLAAARDFPVLTIGSGPACSVRGAGKLAGVDDGIVVDVGGTSTDVGVLVGGFPRESVRGAVIGGVATNFRMPDLVSIAVGGGTVVGTGGRLGPQSVGHRLITEGLCFGGRTATLTDAAVLAGRAQVGTHAVSADRRADAGAALEAADAAVAAAVEQASTSRQPVRLVAVGGGSIVLPDTLAGVATVLRPEHHEVANAYGAAIGDVSGTVDRIVVLDGAGRAAVLAAAERDAIRQAVRAGAHPGRLAVVEREDVALSYLDEPAVRVRTKVAGPVAAD